MKSYENDLEDILAGKMLKSQDLAHLAEFKVDRIMRKRMNKQQPQFKGFNGWWGVGHARLRERCHGITWQSCLPKKYSFQAGKIVIED